MRVTGTVPVTLPVTLLTSLNEEDLKEQGINVSVEEFVVKKAIKAKQVGCDGIIASGREVELIRRAVGDDFLIITPGIRPAGEATQDHKRAVTPRDSILAGADYLVVGRPITQASSPRDAAESIIGEMQAAFDKR